MKKRILSILLTLCIMICLVPTSVFADGGKTEKVGTKDELINALADGTVDIIQLNHDIEVSSTLIVNRTVKLDLYGYMLEISGSGSVIKVKKDGRLTLIDSAPDAAHKFTPNADGLWVLDETNGTKTVKGGVIYGGKGSNIGISVYGGGVYVEGGGTFTMDGGNIVGCTASTTFSARGGGVFVAEKGTFTMSGGSITGCTTVGGYPYGGGIYNEGTVTLSDTAEIRDCHAKDSDGEIAYGGGISDNGETSEISGDVRVTGCTADGGKTDAVSMGFGSVISGGTFDGSVLNSGTISGGTFNGKVVNDGTITDGIFNGEVVNDGGTISGGTFNGTVTYYGTISEGVISGITVTYQLNGADYATQILKSGSTAIRPVDPTNRAGTAFLGWYRADGTAYDFTQPVTENITLTARFAAVTRKVETKEELTAALADDTVDVIELGSDIAIDTTLNITRTVTLDLVGYMLEMKGSGSVITIADDGHLTLVDNNLMETYKFTPDANGLWKWGTSGTKTVHGGVIYGGTGTEMYYSTYGGGVLIEPGGQFTMNGGSIVGCKADGAGGGVVAKCGDANGIFTMNGGAIIGCVADSGGGVETDGGEGVYGQFTMNGGVIDSCVAIGGAGGGGVRSDGLFIMGKDATIKNCKAVQYGQRNFGSGIVLAGDGRQTVDGTIISEDAVDGKYIFVNSSTVAIGENANIHANITLDGGKIDLGGSSATVYGKITNDSYGGAGCFADGLVTVTYKVNNANYAIQILRSGSLATKPTAPAKPNQTFDGWFKADGTAWDYNTAVTEDIILTGSLYVPVTNETELEAALADNTVDVIRLTRNVDIDKGMIIDHTVVVDLNGYVLRQTADKCVSFKVEETGDLTIIDSNPTTPHNFTPNSDGLWVWDETGGTKTVHGGVITGNAAGNSGTIQIGGTVTMTAGNLVGCSTYNTRSGVAPSCGAVYVAANSKFVMNGGAIRGSFARIGDGGGVYVNGGQFTMNGGSISDCTVEHLGGGVYVNFGTFKLVDGYIRNCKADFGGGVCVRANMVSGKDGIFEMSGGVISDCTAKTKGSALLIDGNQLDDTGYAIGGTMYAGGGTVDGTAYIIKYGKITAKGGMTGVTSFKKDILTKAGSKIEYGLFYGDITGEGTVSDITVTYLIDGVKYAKQVLPSAGLATCPDAPDDKTGYTFGGWNKADGTAWDYAKDTVTEGITLYAKWIPHTYTVTFDSTGGSEVTAKTMTATYGEQLGDMPVPIRLGYFFCGWYDAPIDGKCYGNSYGKSTSQYDKTESCTLYAQWKINQYTITFDTAGGSEIASITKDYGTTITAPANPTRKGYKFTGWDKEIPKTMPAGDITITAQWKDVEKPTGKIEIGKNAWNSFLNKITFGLFFNKTQTVTITARDNSGEAVKIEYLLSHKELTAAELKNKTFTAYNGQFNINPDNEYIVYVKLTDKAGNTDYICSEGIVLDKTKPVIVGIKEGTTYCESQTVTINEKYIDIEAVKVNGTKVTLDKNNRFVLEPKDGEQQIVVTDKAGNQAIMTVTINDGHTFGEWKSNGDGTHTRKCTVSGCTEGVETENCSGGKATCKDKAECKFCGTAYGKTDPNNHADLTHITAKAATKEADGNVEYWHCESCDKYYSDVAATKEISKSDTVTERLKEETKSPKTGDSNDFSLWIALLFVCGGICTTLTVKRKKSCRHGGNAK